MLTVCELKRVQHQLLLELTELRYGLKVSEEKRAMRDTAKNLEQMSLKRSIEDRGHMTQRTAHTDTDVVSQMEQVFGIDEQRLDEFKREWEQATQPVNSLYAIEAPSKNTVRWSEHPTHEYVNQSNNKQF